MIRLRTVRYTYRCMRTPLTTFLVLLVVVAGTAGCGGNGDDAAAPETATGAETEAPAETVPELTTCSATDHGLTLPKQDLPPAVAEVRERIFAAVSECDFDGLEKIAREKGGAFTYTSGEPGASPAAYWRNVELNASDSPMYVLALILTLPVARAEGGEYAWPSAHSENPTEADWQALVDAVLYTPTELERMREGGGYTGWRTAITADGDWQYFVTGD
jgi:hypothetical protein